MTRLKDKRYKKPDIDEVVEKFKKDKTFVIGQIYERHAATTLRCKKCKSMAFNVGSGSWFTAIKCVNCEWQICVHDG
jgi:ribosomal protein S27E